MKIAFVFDGLGFGGIERIGLDYVRMSIELGYEVDVYNLNPKFSEMVDDLKRINGRINYFPISFSRKKCPETYSYGIQKWWWGKYAFCAISPILSLYQLLFKVFKKRKKYDIAISIAGHINDLSFVAKSFIVSRTKIVWCHGNMISYLAICDAYSILYKKVDKIVTLSSAAQKDSFAGKMFLYDKKITKIYNPTFINEKIINENYVSMLKEKYGDFILMIARAEWRKGFDVAIKVVKELKDSGLEKKIIFLGDGPCLNEYKELSIKLGVDNLCVFEGNKTNVCDYIVASYVNLLTSRWEGLPTVIIEAMSFGKPCVMTNTDDGEVSCNGKYCMLTEIDDVSDLTFCLKELYTNTSIYNKYCNLSQERSKDFSPKTIKSMFKALIEE